MPKPNRRRNEQTALDAWKTRQQRENEQGLRRFEEFEKALLGGPPLPLLPIPDCAPHWPEFRRMMDARRAAAEAESAKTRDSEGRVASPGDESAGRDRAPESGAWLSESDLAKKGKVNQNTLRTRLREWRKH